MPSDDKKENNATKSAPRLLYEKADRIAIELASGNSHAMQPKAIIQMELMTEPP